MIINDTRGKTEELSLENLEAGKVYVSHRLQKYLLCVYMDMWHVW